MTGPQVIELTVEQAAALLGVDRTTVYRQLWTRKLTGRPVDRWDQPSAAERVLRTVAAHPGSTTAEIAEQTGHTGPARLSAVTVERTAETLVGRKALVRSGGRRSTRTRSGSPYRYSLPDGVDVVEAARRTPTAFTWQVLMGRSDVAVRVLVAVVGAAADRFVTDDPVVGVDRLVVEATGGVDLAAVHPRLPDAARDVARTVLHTALALRTEPDVEEGL